MAINPTPIITQTNHIIISMVSPPRLFHFSKKYITLLTNISTFYIEVPCFLKMITFSSPPTGLNEYI